MFTAIEKVRRASSASASGRDRSTDFFQAAMELQPPPMRQNRRFKMLYATQLEDKHGSVIPLPVFLLFVNDPAIVHGHLSEVSGKQTARGVTPFPDCRCYSSSVGATPKEA